MTETQWSAGDEPNQPNAARIYDYWLGGYHNFEVDRQAAERVMAVYPDVRLAAQANRAFVRRAVSFLCERGVMQFLDIGSGIPTAGYVHEVAQAANPQARVVYVDVDPVAVTHGQAILAGNPNAVAIQADVREPEQLLAHPELRRMLDFGQPIGLLLVAVLHFIFDDPLVERIVAEYRAALPAGSYLVIGHSTNEETPDDEARVRQAYDPKMSGSARRSRATMRRYFNGLEMVEPGLVWIPEWRPEDAGDVFVDHPARSLQLGAIAYKP